MVSVVSVSVSVADFGEEEKITGPGNGNGFPQKQTYAIGGTSNTISPPSPPPQRRRRIRPLLYKFFGVLMVSIGTLYVNQTTLVRLPTMTTTMTTTTTTSDKSAKKSTSTSTSTLIVFDQHKQHQTMMVNGTQSPIITAASTTANSNNNNNNINIKPTTTMHVSYKGTHGLGHRLNRMSGAYHLVKALNLTTSMRVDWGVCDTPRSLEKHIKIWENLFGSVFLDIPAAAAAAAATTTTTTPSSSPPSNFLLFPFVQNVTIMSTKTANGNRLRFKNEVPMYRFAGSKKETTALQAVHYYGKLESDYEMYQQLVQRFQYRKELEQFVSEHDFDNHFVMGLHIRTGNGESGDFANKGRNNVFFERAKNNKDYLSKEDVWITRMAQLLCEFVGENQKQQQQQEVVVPRKPPLIFLATDTSTVLGKLQSALETNSKECAALLLSTPTMNKNTNVNMSMPIKLVTLPQPRIPVGHGHAAVYRHPNATTCIDMWKAQVMDMMILGQYSDVVVTGMYSTFTQTLPLSLKLMFNNAQQTQTQTQTQQQRKNATTFTDSSLNAPSTTMPISTPQPEREGVFCQIGVDATVMECFDNFDDWKNDDSSLLVEGSLLLFGNRTAPRQVNRHQVMLPYGVLSRGKMAKLFQGTNVKLQYRNDESMA